MYGCMATKGWENDVVDYGHMVPYYELMVYTTI